MQWLALIELFYKDIWVLYVQTSLEWNSGILYHFLCTFLDSVLLNVGECLENISTQLCKNTVEFESE